MHFWGGGKHGGRRLPERREKTRAWPVNLGNQWSAGGGNHDSGQRTSGVEGSMVAGGMHGENWAQRTKPMVGGIQEGNWAQEVNPDDH